MKTKPRITRPSRISSSIPLGNTLKEQKGNSVIVWNHVKIRLEIKE
jgi:hypothetical protein